MVNKSKPSSGGSVSSAAGSSSSVGVSTQSGAGGGMSIGSIGSGGASSPRMRMNMNEKEADNRHVGTCTILDTRKYTNTSQARRQLHDESQTWIVAHFLAHQEPIYAMEFNASGRLLVTADSLGQYFNVFQINPNAYKCTRANVKHLYSLYRGDTTSKVKNIAFSNDSRWLAISTKRGTTHIFPINSYGGMVNARTHSKPYVVNRSSKHQRTAGFIDTDTSDFIGSSSSAASGGSTASISQPLSTNLHMDSALSHDLALPITLNNNPKLRNLLEPFIIPAYGQLKQPNANSAFQSSVISSGSDALQSTPHPITSASSSANPTTVSSGSSQSIGTNLAASALSSAALVTENVTSFGIKNFSLLATNTTNMIQYDNVIAASVFAESRGYLSPEEPRDYSISNIKVYLIKLH
jgi:hypothetical protein